MLTELTKRELSGYSIASSGNSRDWTRFNGESSNAANYKKVEISRLQLMLELDAAREFERQRLARELHDQLGQEIIALSLGLRSLKKNLCTTPEADAQLEMLQAIVGQLNKQVHDIACDLRPSILDDLGLREALVALFDRWSLNANIKIDFRDSVLSEFKLSKLMEIEIFRIVQESLTNIVKHAEASNVAIVLTSSKDSLLIHITDDGCGFSKSSGEGRSSESEKKCFGLIGMFERIELLSGSFDIISSSENGTTLNISMPIYCAQKKR